MLNQTAVIDSKGGSFELDLNLQDVNHDIEVEIRPGKYTDNEHVIELEVQMTGFADG